MTSVRLILAAASLAVLESLSPLAAWAAPAVPVYPGAAPGAIPNGVALKAPPAGVKGYSTSDGFAVVKAWYRAHLKDATEMQQPGLEKTEDAFLVGHGPSVTAVMIRSVKGKTWILIGPLT